MLLNQRQQKTSNRRHFTSILQVNLCKPTRREIHRQRFPSNFTELNHYTQATLPCMQELHIYAVFVRLTDALRVFPPLVTLVETAIPWTSPHTVLSRQVQYQRFYDVFHPSVVLIDENQGSGQEECSTSTVNDELYNCSGTTCAHANDDIYKITRPVCSWST